ncbi:MAG: hypothetical protein JXR91_09190 [Deltaproteobacteria bacterium]|nr:hypothetical protein [Deltaproteobacteria bacterium]
MKKTALILSLMSGIFAIAIIAGCGGSQGGGYKSINPGNMPQDGTWDGVYFSDAYGRMELTANGSMVIGLYESERWKGKIEGDTNGNVLNFKWTQFNEDLNGKVRTTSGHGYFVLTSKDEGTAEKSRITFFIKGEWGYGENNSGNNWEAVKFPEGTQKILKMMGAADDADKGSTGKDPFSSPSGAAGSTPSSNSNGGGIDSTGGSNDLNDDVNDLF